MIFALGFLLAGLLALAIAPAFWRRALRLSTRRLEMLLPLSSREIIAERDLMRAEFAIDRRKFEQEAESLRTTRAADMAEIGRRAAQFAAMDERYTALEARHAEQSAELIAARHTEADALAQHAVALSLLHSDGGLVERKEADLMQLRGELAQSRTKIATQSTALADFEALLAIQEAYLTAARNDIARLGEALSSLRLEHEANLATLKATAARLADREEAVKACRAARSRTAAPAGAADRDLARGGTAPC